MLRTVYCKHINSAVTTDNSQRSLICKRLRLFTTRTLHGAIVDKSRRRLTQELQQPPHELLYEVQRCSDSKFYVQQSRKSSSIPTVDGGPTMYAEFLTTHLQSLTEPNCLRRPHDLPLIIVTNCSLPILWTKGLLCTGWIQSVMLLLVVEQVTNAKYQSFLRLSSYLPCVTEAFPEVVLAIADAKA